MSVYGFLEVNQNQLTRAELPWYFIKGECLTWANKKSKIKKIKGCGGFEGVCGVFCFY